MQSGYAIQSFRPTSTANKEGQLVNVDISITIDGLTFKQLLQRNGTIGFARLKQAHWSH